MANHHMVHFGGELVHPNQSFVTGETPGGNAVYMTFDTNFVTTVRRKTAGLLSG